MDTATYVNRRCKLFCQSTDAEHGIYIIQADGSRHNRRGEDSDQSDLCRGSEVCAPDELDGRKDQDGVGYNEGYNVTVSFELNVRL